MAAVCSVGTTPFDVKGLKKKKSTFFLLVAAVLLNRTYNFFFFGWLLRCNITKLCPGWGWDGEGRNWQFSLGYLWDWCFSGWIAGCLGILLLDTWKSWTNNHYVLVIRQTSTYSVGTFHTYCEVRVHRWAPYVCNEIIWCDLPRVLRPPEALGLGGCTSHVVWGTHPYFCMGFCG